MVLLQYRCDGTGSVKGGHADGCINTRLMMSGKRVNLVGRQEFLVVEA